MPPFEPTLQVIKVELSGKTLSMESSVLNTHYIIHISDYT